MDPLNPAGFRNLASERRKGVLIVGQAQWPAVKVSKAVHLLSFKHLHRFMKLQSLTRKRPLTQESSCFPSTLFIPLTELQFTWKTILYPSHIRS